MMNWILNDESQINYDIFSLFEQEFSVVLIA